MGWDGKTHLDRRAYNNTISFICQQLNVPRIRHVIGRRAFASAGPTVWNSLSDNLHNSTVGPDQFQRELKTHLLACLLNISSTALEVFFYIATLYKFSLTYLLILSFR